MVESTKPQLASDYKPEQVALVRATCLYIATKLGDLMDEIVIVGGLVPTLLIDQDALTDDTPAHVGTMDLDVGLALALLDEGRYKEISVRLRSACFEPDENDSGKTTRQRWKLKGMEKVTLDFLIPPSKPGDRGGRLRDLEKDFAAFIAPGLQVAFRDRVKVVLAGKTILDEKATREIWVCGPGAFVVLKALAFDGRGENKDAYDLYYVLRNYGEGVDDVVAKLQPLLDDHDAKRAFEILRRDFLDTDSLGPRRVAAFVTGDVDDGLQADVVGFVTALVEKLSDG